MMIRKNTSKLFFSLSLLLLIIGCRRAKGAEQVQVFEDETASDIEQEASNNFSELQEVERKQELSELVSELQNLATEAETFSASGNNDDSRAIVVQNRRKIATAALLLEGREKRKTRKNNNAGTWKNNRLVRAGIGLGVATASLIGYSVKNATETNEPSKGRRTRTRTKDKSYSTQDTSTFEFTHPQPIELEMDSYGSGYKPTPPKSMSATLLDKLPAEWTLAGTALTSLGYAGKEIYAYFQEQEQSQDMQAGASDEEIEPALPPQVMPAIPPVANGLLQGDVKKAIGPTLANIAGQEAAVQAAKLIKAYPNSELNKKADEVMNKIVDMPEEIDVYKKDEEYPKKLIGKEPENDNEIAHHLLTNTDSLAAIENEGLRNEFRSKVLKEMKDKHFDEIKQRIASQPSPPPSVEVSPAAGGEDPPKKANPSEKKQIKIIDKRIKKYKIWQQLTDAQHALADFQISLRKFCKMIDINHPIIRWIGGFIGMFLYYIFMWAYTSPEEENSYSLNTRSGGATSFNPNSTTDRDLKYLAIFLLFLLFFIAFGYFSTRPARQRRKK